MACGRVRADAAGGAWRAGHRRGAARRGAGPLPDRRGHGLHDVAGQGEHRARPQATGGAQHRPQANRQGRHRLSQLPHGRAGAARPRLRHLQRSEPRRDLRARVLIRGQWPVREKAGVRGDDGGPKRIRAEAGGWRPSPARQPESRHGRSQAGSVAAGEDRRRERRHQRRLGFGDGRPPRPAGAG